MPRNSGPATGQARLKLRRLTSSARNTTAAADQRMKGPSARTMEKMRAAMRLLSSTARSTPRAWAPSITSPTCEDHAASSRVS
ncbi:hypothetical protein ACN28S_23440 [Cystobacter fuscus]